MVLLWSATPVQAAPTSSAQHPAQFHWDAPNVAVVGWRVIGDGKGVYWGPTYLRTTPDSAVHLIDSFNRLRQTP